MAPGRVNLIGEHTDYLGGLAMPAAIDRHAAFALRPRADGRVVIKSAEFQGELTFELDEQPGRLQGWGRYVGGAVRLFQASCGLDRGFDALLMSDVPVGAGVSSSAAVECAVLNALRAHQGADLDDDALERLAQRVEHRFLGVKTGLLDQTASQRARTGHVMVIDFRDMSIRHIVADFGPWSWVLLDSGVRRSLADGRYDQRVNACAEGLRRVAAADPDVRTYRDLRPEHLALLGEATALQDRLRHGITENARVVAAAEALTRGDFAALGALLRASHASLRDDYAVSCPELDALAAAGDAHPACAGGRMVGGGFGGCTLHLVETEGTGDFLKDVSSAYLRFAGRSPVAHRFSLVGGARVVRAGGRAVG